ncbi:hypothetical protein CJ030_MR0G006944 [Morella rubra]|uniref:Uncharacterized protein n=1 Tax=Morella rubra TaxID=262757 RepID=A0A6A1UN28_9ROSI|nr:hypothetical protein CJ030_MR0G006944 [Morella rubra]
MSSAATFGCGDCRVAVAFSVKNNLLALSQLVKIVILLADSVYTCRSRTSSDRTAQDKQENFTSLQENGSSPTNGISPHKSSSATAKGRLRRRYGVEAARLRRLSTSVGAGRQQ